MNDADRYKKEVNNNAPAARKLKNKMINAVTAVNTVICVILFLAMAAMVALYFFRLQYYKIKSENEIPVDELLIFKQSDISDEFDLSYITPEFIGFAFAPNISVGASYGAEAVGDIYSASADYLKYLLGGECICDVKSPAEGEALWKACFAEQNYIYIKYPFSIPADVIYAFVSGDESSFSDAGAENAGVVFINEIFIIFNYYGDSLYNIHAVARDGDKNVVSFDYNLSDSTQRRYFSIDSITPFYYNTGLYVYDFARNRKENLPLPLGDTAIIYNKDIAVRGLSVSDNFEKIFSGEKAEKMVKLFDFNPDKLNSYPEADGTLVYIEKHGTLRVSPDGGIKFTASDSDEGGGIDISNYLNYGSYNGSYNIFEIIKATGTVLNSLRSVDTALAGGQAKLKISGLSYKDGSLIIKYGYYFENIEIGYQDGQPYKGCIFTVKDNKIIEADINTASFYGSSDITANYPQLWMLDKIAALTAGGSGGGDMRLVYIIAREDTQQTERRYMTEWTYIIPGSA